MNLLPKSAGEFGTPEYWDKFFKNRGKKAFDWYGEFPELCGILHKYLTAKNRILNIGCGNSKLSQDLYDVGIRNIVNIDLSAVVIRQMKKANESRTEMEWHEMDATAMTFPDESFTVALDKGTLDALFTDESEGTVARVTQYLTEIDRVLAQGGRYICISLLQSHILRFITQYLPERNFMLRVIRCPEAEKTDGLPVFVLVGTKFRALPTKIYEICLVGHTIQRLKSPEEIVNAIEAVQRSAMVTKGLSKDIAAAKDEVELELFEPGNDTPRYTIHVVDVKRPKRGNGKFACFIVPQGRETEWMFCTKKGRQKLLETAGHDRLAIISTHREHSYPEWKGVQKELDPYVISLAPEGLTAKCMYLSIGAEEVGHRELICKGSSELSGQYVIEDVTIGQRIFRRLIFLQNQATIQSEAALTLVRSKDGSIMEKSIDKSYLACQHHLFMSIGLQFVRARKALLIGLGGGGLCTFISQVLRLNLIAVDIDPAILQVATEFFGLVQSKSMHVVVQDGIEFMKTAVADEIVYDSIMFDVDGKDPTIGMSCPPQAFLTNDTITTVKKLLRKDGIFILNLVCRDETLKRDVIANLKTHFIAVCTYDLDEDLNEVVFCRDTATDWSKMEKAAKELNIAMQKQQMGDDEMIEVDEFMKALQI